MDKIATAADTLGLYATIVYGSDPPENGICMIQAAGAPTEKHLDANMLYHLSVLLNGKHSNQQTVLDALTSIHTMLTKRNDFSDFSTTDAQVLSIMTTASPQIIGREQNNQWIAGSSFEVSFYWR
jgi:hypothetical protein